MHPIIETRRSELTALCRSRGIRRLELFGSAARDDFDESRSDLDFLVQFGHASQGNMLDTYFGLKDDLESLFGRAVDLVSAGSVKNPYVQAAIERDRQLVYSA